MTKKHEQTAQNVFSYFVAKDDSVKISWHGKHVTTVGGTAASRLVTRLNQADAHQTQMLLAKVTGNFKRGNERLGKTRLNRK